MALSAGIVPVRFNDGRWEYLLLRCYKYWDFPKGEVEPKEDPFSSAARELAEETSISSISFPWGKHFYETEVYSKGKIARYYLGFIDGNPKIKLLPNPKTGIVEHHEFRWVEKSEALQLANPRIQKVILWAFQFINQDLKTNHHPKI